MMRKPVVVAPRTPLPHDWRDDGKWKIAASLYRIPQDEYLAEARRFEQEMLANETLSADWVGEWRAWCRRRLTAPRVESVGLFSSI
jgi:hypothetical protein